MAAPRSALCSRCSVFAFLQAGPSCLAPVASARRLGITMDRALKCWICAARLLRRALACCLCRVRALCDLLLCSSVRLQGKAAACSDVEFPCAGACTQDFSQSCPAGWTVDGTGSCVAPASYDGQCVTTKSFANLGLRVRLCLAAFLALGCCALALQVLQTGAPGRLSVECRFGFDLMRTVVAPCVVHLLSLRPCSGHVAKALARVPFPPRALARVAPRLSKRRAQLGAPLCLPVLRYRATALLSVCFRQVVEVWQLLRGSCW